MNIEAIVAQWGKLYRAGQAGPKDLIKMIMAGQDTAAIFPLIPTKNTILEKASVHTTSVIQAFQKKWTPKAGLEFKPRKIELQWLKIDASEYPHELVQSWLGFLAGEDLDPSKWPLVTYWLQELMRQKDKDIEENEIFYGVPSVTVDGTANPDGENLLGIRKQINDAETLGDAQVLPMGAVPEDPEAFVEYMEQMFYDTDELLRNELDGFQMNTTLSQRFKEGMRKKYNLNYKQAGDLATIIDTNCAIRGLRSHAGSDKIWGTPKWNRARGVKNPGNESIFRVYPMHREVCATTDWHMGVGFWVPEYLVTNGEDTDD